MPYFFNCFKVRGIKYYRNIETSPHSLRVVLVAYVEGVHARYRYISLGTKKAIYNPPKKTLIR